MNIKHLEVKRAYYADPENVVVQVYISGEWYDRDGEPMWCETMDYRIKPRTIRIGEIDVPEPERVAPMKQQEYYVAHPLSSGAYMTWWAGNETDNQWLRNGLIHLTREAAEIHAKALILVSGGTIE